MLLVDTIGNISEKIVEIKNRSIFEVLSNWNLGFISSDKKPKICSIC